MQIFIALITLLALQGTAAPARTITIGVDDTMKYSVTAIPAKPGETLRVVVKSTSTLPKLAMAHNFVLLAPGTDAAALVKAGSNSRDTDYIPVAEKAKVLAMTGLAGPGETVEVTFKVPSAPGTYEFICSFPGHYTLGMKGTLTVK
jgi:azurin